MTHLKSLAEQARDAQLNYRGSEHVTAADRAQANADLSSACAAFLNACSAEAILALLAENERLYAVLHTLRSLAYQCAREDPTAVIMARKIDAVLYPLYRSAP